VKTIVLYSSRGGNTGKVADAIASVLKSEAIKVTQASKSDILDLNNFDLIFVGTGVHYASPNEDLMAYLKSINPNTSKMFALFITWGGAGRANLIVVDRLKSLLSSKGQRVIENPFFCYGGWNILRRGHPNEQDIKAAKEWATKIVTTTNNLT